VKSDTSKHEETLIDTLLVALTKAAAFDPADVTRPAAVLWPDKEAQWALLMMKLAARLPHLLTLGAFDPVVKTGPAIWIKAMLARTLPEATWHGDTVPIIYLPGVSKQELRAVEECSPALQPLAELQYRGVVWTQLNGKDWTVRAFLTSEDGGLGLTAAGDQATTAAMRAAIVKLADEPLERWRGRQLDAADFNDLLTPDPARDLLAWISEPEGFKARTDAAVWAALRETCKAKFGFDPDRDGVLDAGEHLGRGEGAWLGVWKRFEEAPERYPGIKERLRKSKPKDGAGLFAAASPVWPQDNELQEVDLQAALLEIGKLAAPKAAARIAEVEQLHGPRRGWVWARMGESPLAGAMEHLATLAALAARPLGGESPQAMADLYTAGGWRVDQAALAALATVRDKKDVGAVGSAARAIYLPWLEAAAEHFQKLVAGAGGTLVNVPEHSAKVEEGCCVLFADGLRYDLGEGLAAVLRGRGLGVELGRRWAALPPVTATAKPAVSPVADLLSKASVADEFRATVEGTGRELTQDIFKRLLGEKGVTFIGEHETGDPTGRAWTEQGAIDKRGHEQGAGLARLIEYEITAMADRIADLLKAGWREVRVVTDHGWLLMPGGLPKVELPRHLTDTRWGRCAALVEGVSVKAIKVPWHWNPTINVAMASGISCFIKNVVYAHGSLSLQECLTPTLSVTAQGIAEMTVSIKGAVWKRLSCKVTVEGAGKGHRVDLRSRPADLTSSMLAAGETPKAVGDDGTVTVYADDGHDGSAALAVVLGPDGQVAAKLATTIGG